MKLVQLSKTIWINADQITYYDEASEQLHFTDGDRMRVTAAVFKKLIVTLQEKKKAAAKKPAN
ncbi:MAG: hypothetical protein K6E41_04535 [Solobacterium sp.]|nr:hypothetical protein [Solobacterium sp.]